MTPQTAIALARGLVGVVCAAGALYLAYRGEDSWGWFLCVAALVAIF